MAPKAKAASSSSAPATAGGVWAELMQAMQDGRIRTCVAPQPPPAASSRSRSPRRESPNDAIDRTREQAKEALESAGFTASAEHEYSVTVEMARHTMRLRDEHGWHREKMAKLKPPQDLSEEAKFLHRLATVEMPPEMSLDERREARRKDVEEAARAANELGGKWLEALAELRDAGYLRL